MCNEQFESTSSAGRIARARVPVKSKTSKHTHSNQLPNASEQKKNIQKCIFKTVIIIFFLSDLLCCVFVLCAQ